MAGRMQRDFHHGLLEDPSVVPPQKDGQGILGPPNVESAAV